MRFILPSKSKLRKARDASKIIINKRKIKKAKEIEVKAKETKIETKIIKESTKANAKANAIITITIATTTINKKGLLRSHEQFACTHVNFALQNNVNTIKLLIIV